MVAALAAALSGCGGAAPTTPGASAPVVSSQAAPQTSSPSAAPKTLESAVAVAQEMSDRAQSGDFAGTWLLFSPTLRTKITQADYVKLGKACGSSPLPVKVVGVRMEGDSTAIVRLTVGDGLVQQARTMHYIDGAWFQEPAEQFAEHLGKPIGALIAAMCPSATK